jgi:hypothetical protein
MKKEKISRFLNDDYIYRDKKRKRALRMINEKMDIMKDLLTAPFTSKEFIKTLRGASAVENASHYLTLHDVWNILSNHPDIEIKNGRWKWKQ